MHFLEIQPHLDNQPAGSTLSPEVVWYDDILYATRIGPKVHLELVDTLSAPFEEPRIKGAIGNCVGRPADWIQEYFEEHFKLTPHFQPPVREGYPEI